jgi:hypothetical protein
VCANSTELFCCNYRHQTARWLLIYCDKHRSSEHSHPHALNPHSVAIATLRLCEPVFLCSCVPMFLCACVPMFLCAHVLVCPCSCVPMFLCAYVPVCLYAHVPVCPCSCVPMFLCACVPVCLCSYVPVFLCACPNAREMQQSFHITSDTCMQLAETLSHSYKTKRQKGGKKIKRKNICPP